MESVQPVGPKLRLASSLHRETWAQQYLSAPLVGLACDNRGGLWRRRGLLCAPFVVFLLQRGSFVLRPADTLDRIPVIREGVPLAHVPPAMMNREALADEEGGTLVMQKHGVGKRRWPKAPPGRELQLVAVCHGPRTTLEGWTAILMLHVQLHVP